MVIIKNQRADLVVKDYRARNKGNVQNSNNFKILADINKEKNHHSLVTEAKGKYPSLSRRSHPLTTNDLQGKETKNPERGKSSIDKPENTNVRRKVLADISNLKSVTSKSVQGKSSGPRYSGSLGRKNSISLAKPLMISRKTKVLDSSFQHGKLKLDSCRTTIGDQKNKIINRNVKVNNTYEHQNKVQSRNSMLATLNSRISTRIPLHMTRKSFPVSKPVMQIKASGALKAQVSGKSEKSDEKSDCPVKPGFRSSFVPLRKYAGSRPLENRVSDSFVAMSSRAQTKVDTGVSSWKYVKPLAKTENTTLKSQSNSRSNKVFSGVKLRSSHAVICNKQRRDRGSPSKKIPSVIPNEKISPKDVISDYASNSGGIKHISSKTKSGRRSSYTFSLMSHSEDPLPNIYDARNHLEVSDYVDDVYEFYWNMEVQNPIVKNYMDIQKEITLHMRATLVNWLIEVHMKFGLMEETLFLTIKLLDRYLSLENIKKNEMQLVGLTAFLLASKYEDFWHPMIKDLISISAESYTRDQMLEMEKKMLKSLKFRLNEPTLYVFMLRFVRAAQLNKKYERLAFYLVELCLVEYEALNYKPSMLCASAVYLARCTLQMTPSWTPLLVKHTRYMESQLRNCTEMILKFHRAANKALLKVTHEKYLQKDQNMVAIIKPLDSLPV